jgi:tetratricopeptide (TPR) repeat protein
VGDYSAALNLAPKSQGALLGRAVALRAAGRAADSVADCTKAIELNPDSSEAYVCRAESYLKMGSPNLALQDLDRAANTVANPARPAITVISAIRQSLESEIAASAAAKPVTESKTAIANNDPRPSNVLPDPPAPSPQAPLVVVQPVNPAAGPANPPPAAVPLSKPEMVAAQNSLQQSREARDYESTGRAYLNQGRIEEALQALSRAIELDPASATALNARGYAYLRIRKLDLALADFSKAISLNPDYGNAYQNRGAARKLNGDRDGSIEDIRRAKTLDAVASRKP